MNQLALFKLFIPAIKTTNKLFHSQPQKNTDFMKKLCANQNRFGIDQDGEIVKTQSPYSILSQQIFERHLQFNEKQQQLQQVDLTKTTTSFFDSEISIKKNFIDGRIKTAQYEANNPCQDSFTYQQLKAIDAYTVSIFDGHGGPQLAQYSKSKISSFIDSYLQKNMENPDFLANIGNVIKDSLKWSYQKIEDTFFEIYEHQIKIGNKKIRNVGTCGITAVVHNDRVYVGNSGDSQAVFILKEGLNLIRSEKANERLSANNKNERERIKKQWENIDEDIISEQSSNCYYLKGRLQPTRTIGDYYLKNKEYYNGSDEFKGPYLSCLPNINQHEITKAHKYMVIASDGVWDVLSKNEVMNYLLTEQEIDLSKTCYDMDSDHSAPYINNVVNNVLEKACEMSGKKIQDLRNMQKGMRRNYHDDITIAVISLENQI